MQGRDAKGRSANRRGRGHNGRGGRGMARPPPRTGTVAAIGAYLDLLPGKEVNPVVVTNWVNKFREYVVTVCETSRINLIFGIDATLGDYPKLQEPKLPDETSTRFQIKIWEIAYAKFIKDVDRLETDKLKVFGLMMGQMSENSKNRVKETDAGSIAIEEQDPRLLLTAILATDLTDNRLGAEHNLYKIEQAFHRYSTLWSQETLWLSTINDFELYSAAYKKHTIGPSRQHLYGCTASVEIHLGTQLILQCIQTIL
jgi:hypothetical protein